MFLKLHISIYFELNKQTNKQGYFSLFFSSDTQKTITDYYFFFFFFVNHCSKITIEDSKPDNTTFSGRTESFHQLAYVDH